MEKRALSISYVVYENVEALPKEDYQLFQSALGAAENAYAPYSNYFVGAAANAGGETFLGNNQENAAYPSGICAERSLMYWLGANHPEKKVDALAVIGRPKESLTDVPITPCGACRQALLEYEGRQQSPIRVIFRGSDGGIWVFPSVIALLPFAFTSKNLHE